MSSPEREGRLVVISGPSGSGKTTIIHRLLDSIELHFSVSATTRSPRPDEVDGVDYFFMERKDFERLRGERGLLEWAEYNGNLYGTPAAPVQAAISAGKIVLLDIELLGARQVRELRPDALMIFIAPPSVQELETRLRHRGDTSEEEIRGRLAIAESQLAEAREIFDQIVVNRDLDAATAEVANLVIGNG